MNHLLNLKHRRWLISSLVVLAAIAISLNWLHLHPGDAYIKIMAIGASVCHQLPSHSFQREGLQFPICARCSGLYLGCFIGIVYYAFQGRKSGLPRRGYLVLFIILFIVWAGDGFNSFINDLLGRTLLYATTNATRLVTGFGMGLVLSTALMTLFNLSVWKDPQRKPLLNNLWQVLAYMVSAGVDRQPAGFFRQLYFPEPGLPRRAGHSGGHFGFIYHFLGDRIEERKHI